MRGSDMGPSSTRRARERRCQRGRRGWRPRRPASGARGSGQREAAGGGLHRRPGPARSWRRAPPRSRLAAPAGSHGAALAPPTRTHLQRRVPQHLLELHVAHGVALQQLVDHLVEHLGLLARVPPHARRVVHHDRAERQRARKRGAAKARLVRDRSRDALGGGERAGRGPLSGARGGRACGRAGRRRWPAASAAARPGGEAPAAAAAAAAHRAQRRVRGRHAARVHDRADVPHPLFQPLGEDLGGRGEGRSGAGPQALLCACACGAGALPPRPAPLRERRPRLQPRRHARRAACQPHPLACPTPAAARTLSVCAVNHAQKPARNTRLANMSLTPLPGSMGIAITAMSCSGRTPPSSGEAASLAFWGGGGGGRAGLQRGGL
jgi:hypothetical protein